MVQLGCSNTYTLNYLLLQYKCSNVDDFLCNSWDIRKRGSRFCYRENVTPQPFAAFLGNLSTNQPDKGVSALHFSYTLPVGGRHGRP